MADQPIPFWRKLAEAVGLSEPDLPAAPPRPAAPAPPAARSAAAAAPAAPAGVASTPSPAASTSAPGSPPPTASASSPAAAPAASPTSPTSQPAPGAGPGAPQPAAPAPATEPEPAPDAEALLELWFARGEDDVVAWQRCVPGPSVAEIATRLSLVPPAFLADGVAILSLAEHILGVEYGSAAAAGAKRQAGWVLDVVEQVRATGSGAARRGAALALWLWASDDVHGPVSVPLTVVFQHRALAALAFRLAAVVDPAEWVRDVDRRDEAARQFLFWSGLLPAGEDEATAQSILAMRDSLQQNSALAQTLADHEHRLEVSRRLREARAREAAARYSSE